MSTPVDLKPHAEALALFLYPEAVRDGHALICAPDVRVAVDGMRSGSHPQDHAPARPARHPAQNLRAKNQRRPRRQALPKPPPRPAKPDQVWAGDSTCIPTSAGWLYLAVVIDLC